MPGLTPAWGQVLAEAASVCLEDQNHGISVELAVTGDFRSTVRLTLTRLLVDEQMQRAHGDQGRGTENGAYGVAILTICGLTNLRVLYQSRRGTGFDYWLGTEDGPLLYNATRLEVSGIRKGTPRSVDARARDKVRQTERSDGAAPALVAIVEFSEPALRIVRR